MDIILLSRIEKKAFRSIEEKGINLFAHNRCKDSNLLSKLKRILGTIFSQQYLLFSNFDVMNYNMVTLMLCLG